MAAGHGQHQEGPQKVELFFDGEGPQVAGLGDGGVHALGEAGDVLQVQQVPGDVGVHGCVADEGDDREAEKGGVVEGKDPQGPADDERAELVTMAPGLAACCARIGSLAGGEEEAGDEEAAENEEGPHPEPAELPRASQHVRDVEVVVQHHGGHCQSAKGIQLGHVAARDWRESLRRHERRVCQSHGVGRELWVN